MKFCIFILLMISSANLHSQKLIPIWPDQIPNAIPGEETEQVSDTDIIRIGFVQEPTIEAYLPSRRNSNGYGVIICPGGGYHRLAYDWEGTDVAKWFNSRGIAAFVLKYRLPVSRTIDPERAFETPLIDSQQAIRYVRKNAKEFRIDPDKIGIMGFSAGGHLASTLGTHYKYESPSVPAELKKVSAKPNFMVLIYPVITMDISFTHHGSRKALIGKNPDKEMETLFSNEKQIDAETPPTFLIHSADDGAVPVQNAIAFYQNLVLNEVPAEMHLYPFGGHGYGLALKQDQLSKWPQRLIEWLNNLE